MSKVRSSRVRLLLADDEPSLLHLLEASLELEGYDVILASDGRTAVELVEREKPDVVVLDVMMPKLDGWGVLERLRDLPKRPRVICLTAKGNLQDRVKGAMLGADEYVTKPFELERLLIVIREVQARSVEEQAIRRQSALQKLLGNG